jgi:hypothetical protein
MIVNLPKVGAVEFPDNLTPEQYSDLVGQLATKYDFKVPKAPASLGTIAKRGVMRGLGELGIAATDVLPGMVGSALGFEDYARRQMGEAATTREELQRKYPTRFKSYTEVSSPFEALEYAAETAGELLPTIGTSIIPGVGGGVLGGRLAGQAALRSAQAAGPASRAALAGVEQAAQAGARSGMYGGVFLGSYAQNTPEIFEGIYRETGNLESGIAALMGGLSASLDSVLPVKVLDTLGGYGKAKLIEELAKKSGAAPVAWRTIGKEAAKIAGTEGLTESAQQAIGVYAQKLAGSTEDLLSPENIQDYKEAFVKGAVGGGLFGAPAGVSRYRTEKRDYVATQEANKALQEQAAAEAGQTTPLQERINALVSGRMDTPITQEELEAAFKYTQEDLAALQARMDATRPGSEAYAELDAAIKAKQNEAAALDAKKAEMSAFATATPDEQGMIRPPETAAGVPTIAPGALEQIQPTTEAEPTVRPESPIKALGLNPRSKVGRTVAALDLGTPEGVNTLVKTLEDPAFMGKINEAAYDNLISQLDPAQVETARAELKGAPSAARPIEQPSGAGVGVAGEPAGGAAPAGLGAPEPDGVVPAAADAGQPVGGEAEQPGAVTVPRETKPKRVSKKAPAKTEADITKVNALDKQKLTPQERDARAYFGRMDSETALRTIANDLVLQPTAYRNAKMKSLPDEAYFASEKEAQTFRGQGGIHAKNAEAWARANLSPEQVAYLDKWIAQYQKEEQKSTKYRKRLEKQQERGAALKETVEAETTKLTTAQELKNYGIKAEVRTRKEARKIAERVVRDMGDVAEDMMPILDSDLDALLASPEIASLSTSLHPTVEAALRQGNLSRALGLFADSVDQPRLARIAEALSSVLGDVKVVYGAEKAMYDPKTNTIYLPEDATDYELIHEASHAGLSHIIANPSHPVTRQLAKIFEQVKADVNGAYGAKNLQEFVAEIWSNENFRTQLKEKRSEVPTLSVWDKIIRAVRRFLRLPERTEATLDQVDRLLDSIVGPPPDARSGDTLYSGAIHDPGTMNRVLQGMDRVLQSHTRMTPDQSARFVSSMETVGLTLRQGLQKFLNLSAVGQVGARFVGQDAITFADTVNEMAGYRENLIEKLMPLDKRLQAYSQDPEFRRWTKMVHDHTREDVNPEAPASKYAGSEKADLHRQFGAEFNTLSDTGKQLYRDLFSAYKKLFKELQTSLYSNLVEVHAEGTAERESALGAYEKVIGMIIAKGIDHYAPLYRQGTYWLEYKDRDGEMVRELYNSQIERTSARTRLEREGNTDFDEYMKVEGKTARRAPSGTIAAQIIKIMKDGGAEDTAVDRFLELIVSAMPETSILKSFNARKGTLGYEDNAATAFRNVTNNLVGQLARMRYSDKLQGLLDNMAQKTQELRGEDSIRGAEVVRELESRYQFAMKPTIEAWARWASGGAFYFNLAGNISSATVNLLQTPMVVFPQLGGTYGFLEAGKALMAATRLYSGSGFSRTVTDINGQQVEQNAMLSVENLVNSGRAPQYKVLVQRLKELGFLQTSTARDALEASNMPGADPSVLKTTAEKTALYSSFLFHHAERMNREVTAVAAYDLEMQRLAKRGVTGEAAQAQAIDKAIRMVEFTHGAGHTESGPSISQSSLGKVLTVFKRFAFTMYYMLFDTIRRSLPVPADATPEQREMAMAARRQLVGIYGMSAIFAGAKGVPLYWIAEAAYNAFADDDEDQFDDVMRRYLGEFFFKGPVNYLTNLGIADRVGWTDLIYRDQKGDKADASVLSQFLENILGAPYAVVNNIFRGQELIAEGQFSRGVETMLPVALKNVMKGFRYATEDARTLRGDMVGEVNGYNAAMQVLGFAPADLLTKYEENAYIKGREDATVGQAKKLLKQYYVALNMGDQERMDAIEDKLFELGDKHPELNISGATISKSIKARDAISKDMYQGIEINKRMRESLINASEDIYK